MNCWITRYGVKPSETISLLSKGIPKWQFSSDNPSCLCQHGNFLYVGGEFPDKSTVTSFIYNGFSWEMTGLTEINAKQLCHLSISPKNQLIAGACWGDGSVFTLKYNKTGRLLKESFRIINSCAKTSDSHAHCSIFFENELYSTDIGLDKINCFSLHNGYFHLHSSITLPSGSGPRHIVLNRKKRFLYCITENSCELFTLNIRTPSQMKMLSSSKIEHCAFNDVCYGASLALSEDCRHLYASVRGTDKIYHFYINSYGLPVLADSAFCHGNWPRHICLIDHDRFLGIANQKSDELIILKRNSLTGSLYRNPYIRVSYPGINFIEENRCKS